MNRFIFRFVLGMVIFALGTSRSVAQPADSSACACIDSTVVNRRYFPRLSEILSDSDFKSITKITLSEGENPLERLYFARHNHRSGIHVLTIVSGTPIKLLVPDGSHTINFTPCTPADKRYKFPITVSIQNLVRRYVSNLDYRDFDYTAHTYFKVYAAYNGLSPKLAAEKVLHAWVLRNYSQNSVELNKQIGIINKNYGTKLKPVKDSGNTEKFYKDFLAELQNQNIDISKFMIEHYVLENSTEHKITELESQRLAELLDVKDFRRGSVRELNELIFPKIRGGADIKNIEVEIESDMLRIWDIENARAVTNEQNAYLPAIFPVVTNGVRYDAHLGQETIGFDVLRTCFGYYEIANTNIFFEPQKVRYVDIKKQDSSSGGHRAEQAYYNNTLIDRDTARQKVSPEQMGQPFYPIVHLFGDFSGLFIEEATLGLVIDKKVVYADRAYFLANDKLTSGIIAIKTENELTESNDAVVLKLQDNEILETTVSNLKKHFLKLDLTVDIVKEGKHHLNVHFKKNGKK